MNFMFKLISYAIVITNLFTITQSCGCGNMVPQDPFDPLGKWHQRHLECGIPPFAYRLPQEAQAKIHSIWIKYEIGNDCEEEQEATREVIFSIPENIRLAAFKGICGPGFLANESDDVRDAFIKVWNNENMKIDEKENEFRNLAKQYLSGKSAEKFEKFANKLTEAKKQREETIKEMSEAAQEAYNKWIALRKNERIFLNSLPHDVRAELGLVCKCCKECKSEQQNNRASRSIHVDDLVGALTCADRKILEEAADSECKLNY